MELGHVEGLVDVPGDGFDLRAQLLLDSVEGESVIVGDQVDGDTKVAEPGNEIWAWEFTYENEQNNFKFSLTNVSK